MFTSEQFTMWLNGFFELTDATELTPAQVAMIKEHLALVFNKVTKPLEKPIPPPTKMLWEGEDPRKRKDIKQLEDLAEEVKAKQRDKQAWQELIEQVKEVGKCVAIGDLGKPYCEPKSPYNGVTPIADWTVRFPYHCDFYTTTPTYVNLPTSIC